MMDLDLEEWEARVLSEETTISAELLQELIRLAKLGQSLERHYTHRSLRLMQ
jgi:hypothetical protein